MPPKKNVMPTSKGPAKPPAKTPTTSNTTKAGSKAPTVAKKTTPASGAKKSGTVQKGKPSPATKDKPKEKVWTKEDEAARKIQTCYRQFRAKKKFLQKKKEKEDYNELMDKLEKEAFIHMVKMEQEQAEKERQKEEEERKRKREEQKRKKRMLEAAFDGDLDNIHTILQEVVDLDTQNNVGHDVIGRAIRNRHLMAMIECEDANANTPLSEAASGGDVETIKFLLNKGADPNCKGQFERTPLYRAAFAGHLEVCEILLQNGGDPRIYAGDGQTPKDISSVRAISDMIESWDIAQTENLLGKLEIMKEERLEEERKRMEAEQSKLEEQIAMLDKDYKSKQKQLEKAHCELNKRITEHDQCVASGFERPEITLQAIHDAEADLEIIKMDTEKARDKVAQARLTLREQQKTGADLSSDDLPGLKVPIRELDEVLMRDVGNKIMESGRWPLIIDRSSQAATFLRYRDTNYLNTLNPQEMEADRVRLAILGAIRYGKPLVVDMMQVDMFDTVSDRLDEIQKGLMNMIMDKSILEEERYLSLVRPKDGDQYDKTKFNDMRTKNFRLFILTQNTLPPVELMDKTYPIRIHIPT